MRKDPEIMEATAIVGALCELMAAHEAVWRHGAPQRTWDAPRDKAITTIADALRAAGKVRIKPD